MCYLGNIRKSCMGLAVLHCTTIVHIFIVLHEDRVEKMDDAYQVLFFGWREAV